MAIELRSSSSVSGSFTTATLALPTGVVGDDVVIAAMTNAGNANAASLITAPSGFAYITGFPAVDGARGLHMFWRRASAAQSGNVSFVVSAGAIRFVSLTCFSGIVKSGSPFNVTTAASETVADATSADVSLTTTVDNAMLVWANSRNVTGTTTLTGLTSLVNDAFLGLQYGIKATAGSTGSQVVTLSNNSTSGNSAGLIALTPEVSPSGFFTFFR